MAPRKAPSSLPNLHFEGTQSRSDSDLGSFKFIESSFTFSLQHSTLPATGDARPLILPNAPNYPHNYSDSPGLSRFKSSSAIDRPRSGTNQLFPISHPEQSSTPNSPSLPLSPTSEYSSYSLRTVSEELGIRTSSTKSYESTPALCGPGWDLFKSTIDKALLEPSHTTSFKGYVPAQSFPNPSKLPRSTRSYLKPPTLSGHPPAPPTRSHSSTKSRPRTGLSSSNLPSESSYFETAPTSPDVSSGSFATAPMSPAAANKSIISNNSVNFHNFQPHMRNENADVYRPFSSKSTNPIAMNNSLFRPQVEQSVFADDKAYVSDSSFPQRPDSLFSPSSHIRAQEPLIPKGKVHGGFFTTAMYAAVNDAAVLYQDRVLDSSEGLLIPSSLYLPEALAYRYALAVDAKNALMLRQSAILTDVGICLESIIPMINLYSTDEVRLTNIHQDLEDIRQACDKHQIKLQFGDLEWHRSAKDPCGLAFVDDKRYQGFSWKESTMAIDGCGGAQVIGLRFVKDPAALVENRLPKGRRQG